MGDLLGGLKGTLVNLVVRKVKKMVPAYSLPGAIAFNKVLAEGTRRRWQAGRVIGHDDIAFLQYTGGTTGVSKGRRAAAPPRDRQRAAERSLVRADPEPHAAGRAGAVCRARCRCTTSMR